MIEKRKTKERRGVRWKGTVKGQKGTGDRLEKNGEGENEKRKIATMHFFLKSICKRTKKGINVPTDLPHQTGKKRNKTHSLSHTQELP